jgi:uncharacterized membrane protein YbhN (UPF0104 family)
MTSRARVLAVLLAMTVFAASAWYLAERFQWQAAFGHLLRTDFIRLIILICATHFAYICVRTWRWRTLVRNVNPDVGFMDLYWITAVAVSLAILTPGQLGEALKIELLSRRGLLGRLPGLGAFALERIMDILVLACMGLVGLVFGSGLEESYPGLGIGIGTLILAGLLALYLLLRFRPGGRVTHWLEQIRNGSGSPTVWLKTALLTLLAWLLIGVGWQIALYAIDIQLSLPEVVWLIALVTFGTLLSFIPGGLGVAEVLTVEALTNIGVDPIPAQAGALILRAYAVIVVFYGLVHLLLWLNLRFFIRSRSHDSSH